MNARTLIAALFAGAALTTSQSTDAQYCGPGYIPDRFFYGRQPVYYPYNPYRQQIIIRGGNCRPYVPVWERSEKRNERVTRRREAPQELEPGRVYLIDGNLVEINKDPKTGKISTSVIPLNQAAPETVWVADTTQYREHDTGTKHKKHKGKKGKTHSQDYRSSDDKGPQEMQPDTTSAYTDTTKALQAKQQPHDSTGALPDTTGYKSRKLQRMPEDTTRADSLESRRYDVQQKSRSDSVLTTMPADSGCYSCHSAEILRKMRVVPGTKGKEDDDAISKERKNMKTKEPQPTADTLRTSTRTYQDSLRIMEKELDEYMDREFGEIEPEVRDLVHKRFGPYLKKRPQEWNRMRDDAQREDAFEDYLLTREKDWALMKKLQSR